MPKRTPNSKVPEAAAKYVVDRQGNDAVATISTKNQITLPAHLLRELGIGPGDRLAIKLEGKRLVMRPRPKNWAEYYAGSLRGVYGDTAAEIDAYVKELRENTERDEAIERAWSGQRPPSQP